jgi:hypothetical protein
MPITEKLSAARFDASVSRARLAREAQTDLRGGLGEHGEEIGDGFEGSEVGQVHAGGEGHLLAAAQAQRVECGLQVCAGQRLPVYGQHPLALGQRIARQPRESLEEEGAMAQKGGDSGL